MHCARAAADARLEEAGGLALAVRAVSHPSGARHSLIVVLAGDYLRRGVAEFVGTFALIFVGAGSVAFARTGTDVALAHGLVICVMVSAVGMISGGHFNPAVTLGFVVTGRITRALAAWYWLVQFSAAALGALLLRWVLPVEVRNASAGVQASSSRRS
jgi:glycerol uptake facilitator-like aquaporin